VTTTQSCDDFPASWSSWSLEHARMGGGGGGGRFN
jgi:hypothetical protein